MEFDFSNKVALVTGAGGAVGSILVKAFLASKATVIAADFQENITTETKSEMSKATFIKADITKEEETKKLVSGIVQRFGRIDILANVVGGYLAGKSIVELDVQEWDNMINTDALYSSHL